MSNSKYLEKKNLFKQPDSYQFSKVDNKTIFYWKKKRNFIVNKIISNFLLKNKNFLVHNIFSNSLNLKSYKKKNEIKFNDLLDENLLLYKNNSIKNKKVIINFLNIFQKKFEIYRRLHDRYHINYKRISSTRTLTFSEYCKFSYFLMLSSEKFKNYSYLSTSMKLIDALLSNNLTFITTSYDAKRIIFLIKYEAKIIQNLQKK